MKLCNHRYPRNAEGRCTLRCTEVAGDVWKYDSYHVFAAEGEMPTRRLGGTFVCTERMTAICPYRVHTPHEKPKPATWVQCPYCEGRHRTEQAVTTCKAYGEWSKAMHKAVDSNSHIPYDENGTKEEIFPDSVLKFKGFQNVRAHIWPSMQYAIVKRDNKTCQDCGAKKGDKYPNGYEMPFEVHHIIPRGLGGSDHPKNLKLVCYECHKKYNRKFNPIIKRKNSAKRKAKELKVESLDGY